MFLIVALLVVQSVISDAHSVSQSCQCGIQGGQTRIVGGSEAQEGKYLWMVALIKNMKQICGGTLINDRYVLTAAHCVDNGTNPADLNIVVRHVDLANGVYPQNVLDIQSIWIHPEYQGKENGYKNDLAILKLTSQVQFDDTLGPICLPNKNQRDFDNLFNMGWGSSVWKGQGSADLLYIDVKEDKNCADSWGPGQIWDKQICTHTKGKGVCSGDSGGPLASTIGGRVTQIGINSFVVYGTCGVHPDVMTRVSEYVDDIYAQTSDATYCNNPNDQ